MREHLFTTLTLILAAIIVFTAAAQDAVKLQYKMQESDVLEYQNQVLIKQSTPMGAIDLKMEGLDTQSIIEVGQENNIKMARLIEIKVSRAMMGNNDMTTMVASQLDRVGNQFASSLMRRNGQLAKSEAGAASSTISSMLGGIGLNNRQMSGQLIFPEAEVKTGESWAHSLAGDGKISLPGDMSMEIEGSSKYTLLGFESVNGYRCAKIQLVMSGSGKSAFGEIQTEGETTVFFAVNEGFLVKSDGAFTMKMGQMGTSEIQIVGELKRRSKIPLEELPQLRQEVATLEAGYAHLTKNDFDSAKKEAERFLSTYPQSRFRKGAEGLIAQIEIMKQMSGTMNR